jgi:hypothetical protein
MRRIGILVLAFLLFVQCQSGKQQSSEAAEKSQKVETSSQTTLYACPMKCEGDKTYSEPGTCPLCEMELEPLASLPQENLELELDSALDSNP